MPAQRLKISWNDNGSVGLRRAVGIADICYGWNSSWIIYFGSLACLKSVVEVFFNQMGERETVNQTPSTLARNVPPCPYVIMGVSTKVWPLVPRETDRAMASKTLDHISNRLGMKTVRDSLSPRSLNTRS